MEWPIGALTCDWTENCFLHRLLQKTVINKKGVCENKKMFDLNHLVLNQLHSVRRESYPECPK